MACASSAGMASEGVVPYNPSMTSDEENSPACVRLSVPEDGDCELVLRLRGRWLLSEARPRFEDIVAGVEARRYSAMRFDVESLNAWDTALLIFIRACQDWAEQAGLTCQLADLPAGVQNMLKLARAVPKNTSAADQKLRGWLSQLGWQSIGLFGGIERSLVFFGELLLDFKAFCQGKVKTRPRDFLFLLQTTGAMAVPIVSLLSFLTGLIIAFIGVIQLQKFAADIYVADLVGLATTRELGAVMAGVIMAGRTGAAFAAQIGSMKVNEEIDALTTFGISPMQFLVLPRVLAMVLVMPLLCACANFISIAGGMVVAVAISDVSITQYINQIDYAVSTVDLMVGIFKSAVFGFIVAVAGCYRGLNCGNDASAVGLAATSAVVTAITWIVVADALFAVLFHILGL